MRKEITSYIIAIDWNSCLYKFLKEQKAEKYEKRRRKKEKKLILSYGIEKSSIGFMC